MKIEFYDSYGNFNLMDSSEYTTRFTCAIRDENGVVKINDVACKLFWQEDGDNRGRWSFEDGLDYLVEQSWEYSKKVWGSTDYEQQTLNFVKCYNSNREELAKSFEEERKESIKKEIERLQRELEGTVLNGEAIDASGIIGKEVAKYKKWIASEEQNMSQYKEDSELYKKGAEKIKGYEEKIKTLESIHAAWPSIKYSPNA